MGPVVFDELYPGILLFPKFQMTIDRRGDQKFGSGKIDECMNYITKLGEIFSLCYDTEIDHVAVHETLVILICVREMVQKQAFMRKN